MQNGSCRFGLWRVAVAWEGNTVYRVAFLKGNGPAGEVPAQFTRFLAGKQTDFAPFVAENTLRDSVYGRIYAAAASIPYGETRTYAEVAGMADTHPRVVGNAMARNTVSLLVPCHRVVAADGIGGYGDISLKEDLLALEQKVLMKNRRECPV
jgi:methylated-DNA-[protein]-cysteine S-methyltransferase